MDGALIAESLRAGASLSVPLRLRTMSRFEITGAAPAQPSTWTLIEFEGDDTDAEPLADALASGLNETGGWYADFATPSTKYVVFARRVFRFAHGDEAADQEARDYARSIGVPETQIDWAR
jgi:hypothetical protein